MLRRSLAGEFQGVPTRFAGLDDLIAMKEASGRREKDLPDLRRLRRLRPRHLPPPEEAMTVRPALRLLAADDADLRLVVAGPDGWGSESYTAAVEVAAHRDGVTKAFTSAKVKEVIQRRGIQLVSYHDMWQ